jgi:KUP system potassium uptake protein
MAPTLALVVPLFLLELVFLSANLLKIHDGGYVPIMIAGLVVTIMWTWRRGSRIISDKARRTHIPLRDFARSIERKSAHGPHLVTGTAIFLTSQPESTPPALLHNIKHNHVLHENNIILTIRTENYPTVPLDQRGSFEKVSPQFSILTLRFGFMDTPTSRRRWRICARAD